MDLHSIPGGFESLNPLNPQNHYRVGHLILRVPAIWDLVTLKMPDACLGEQVSANVQPYTTSFSKLFFPAKISKKGSLPPETQVSSWFNPDSVASWCSYHQTDVICRNY